MSALAEINPRQVSISSILEFRSKTFIKPRSPAEQAYENMQESFEKDPDLLKNLYLWFVVRTISKGTYLNAIKLNVSGWPGRIHPALDRHSASPF